MNIVDMFFISLTITDIIFSIANIIKGNMAAAFWFAMGAFWFAVATLV